MDKELETNVDEGRVGNPESRADAEARAEKLDFPKGNVICLEGDDWCYIAPRGITLQAAKQAYAEARKRFHEEGRSDEYGQEHAAKIAWYVQEKAERSASDKTTQRGDRTDKKCLAETRNSKLEYEYREKAKEGDKLVIRGFPILFNMPTKIRDWGGEYEEVILSSALDETALDDVLLLGNHDAKELLGRAGVNMRLEVNKDVGLFFEATMPNTNAGRDYYNLVKAGLLDGMSFGFTTSDEIRFENGRDIRKIEKIDKLFEITLTPFPAYFEASVVAARNETPPAPPQPAEPTAEEKAEAEAKAQAASEEEAAKAKAEAEAAAEARKLEVAQNEIKEI